MRRGSGNTWGRISGDRNQVNREAIRRIEEAYTPDTIDAVLDAYLDGYADVYDTGDWTAFLERVWEEVLADAYAGINAFGTDGGRFRGTVNAVMDDNGMGRDVWNAQEQERYAAPGGDQRVYADEDAPPPRDEDYSQMPQEEYDWDGWDDSMIDFSYGGEKAKSADREALERAQRMEEQGFNTVQIFQDTGWFRGADGKWRFEIDDTGMKYHKMGDAQFSKDHPEYRRYRELELKYIECTITDAEIAEMAELRSTWANEAPRLRQMVVRGNAKLYQVLAHDALFEQYPQLRDTRVRFGETDAAGGWWDKEQNEIVISNRYRHADPGFLELTLLHEIQHAIQDIEGFAGGSNPEYWEERQRGSSPIRENDAAIAKAQREAQEALQRVPPAVQKDFWYAANMQENDPEGAEKLENELFEGEYSDAYSDYSWAIWTLQDLLEQENPRRTAKDLYRNTAGEIEARDTANRRSLDAEARKKRLPDTGDEGTVFVEGKTFFEMNTDISDERNLKEELNTVMRSAEPFDGRYIDMGRFSETFTRLVAGYLDLKDVPVVMNYRDAYLAMESKEKGRYQGQGINYHNLGVDGMMNAIRGLNDPVAIMKSKKDGKIELALSGVDSKGNGLLAIVAVNTVKQNAGVFAEVHVVTSIYGRRNIDRYIERAESDGRGIYNKKEEPAQGITQVQYEGDINASSPGNSVPDSGQNVKPNVGSDDGVRFSLDSKGREYTMQDIGALQQERYQLKEERNRLLTANPNYAKAQEDRRYANTFQERIAASKALRAAEAEVDTARIDARMSEIDDLITEIRETEKRKHERERELYSGTKTAGYSTLPDTRIKQLDAEYEAAVRSGDKKRMGELVQEAAEAAMPKSTVRGKDGTLLKVYHYTNAKFTRFDRGQARTGNEMDGFFFAPDPESSREYGKRRVAAYLNITNPAKDPYLDRLHDDSGTLLREKLAYQGYDGVVRTEADGSIYEYMAFDPEQIKSAEPVVYDDRGGVVPLSKRFDFTNPDIRFSLEDGTDDQELVERMAARMERTVMELNAQEIAVHNARVDAENREAAAKAERKRQSEKRQMERNRERAQRHKEERQRLRREANAVMTDDLQRFGKPQWAKRDTAKRIMELFSTPSGMKTETRAMIEGYLEHILGKGYIEDDDRRNLMDKLIESGVVEIEPDEIMAEGRSYLKGNKIYISPEMVRELGDDWPVLHRKAFGLGVYLTTDRQYAGLDVWNADMASYLPGFFDENETDPRTQLERLLWVAEEGKAEKLSLSEYTQRLAQQEQVTEADLLDSLDEKLDRELKQFARDADVEMRLRGYTRKNIGERMHRQLTRKRLQRAADKAHYRETMQRARNRRELNKLQERTLKTLQWLNRNKYRASEELQARIQEVLSDIDLYAVGAANELNWHPRYEMTWRDLADVFKASKDNPNFLPSAELERIVARLDNRKIEDLDIGALNDLFNAAVGLRKEMFDAEKALSFADGQRFDDLYLQMTGEMESAKKPRKGSFRDKFFNIDQLTPMNVLRQMGGWRPDGALARMAGLLEKGEKDVRAYKVKASRILADWLEDHRDWVHKADGQGKDGIWIEVEIPQLEGIGLDGGATFGDTVTVKMTPLQRVHLFLESRNEDNLRHMVGGRTFADPELYSQGKRTEAYAQGITVKMAPETVRTLVQNLSPEELELARLLDSYYNGLAHDEINRVSNKLYGYNKAMGKRYAPIFTNRNFTKSEAGLFDQTAEGVGNLKARLHVKNPSYNISALDAFERNVDKTAEFVGMAIPARDWNSLLNWQTRDSSMKDEITHQWGQERLDYIDKLLVDLQGGTPAKAGVLQVLGDKLLSNYISSVFGFNPSIVLKQAGSLPLAAAYLGAENMSFDMLRKERRSREFISKYTQELQWRSMGYDMPETRQLKDEPGWAQKSGRKWVENTFGGGFITKMDEATASILWAWAESKVEKEHPGLEVGDQTTIDEGRSPFYQKVAEEFDRAVSHSQSVSDVAHQSTMRRSRNVLARTYTMFRSDSAQTYNALRQMWGEKEYWDGRAKQLEGAETDSDKEKLKEAQEQRKKAGKRIGTVVVATVCNAVLAELVDFAMAAIKGRLKNYEDEEEERLTAMSILDEMCAGLLESGAGIVTGGDEIASLFGRFITGEKGYNEEAPGLEQLLDLEDRIVTAVQGVKKGEILGAVREVGMAFSTYYAGFPAENMEKFLITGIAKHLVPDLVTGYEDALETPEKADLKGMTGAALEVRLGHVMKAYGMELDDESCKVLAKLYEAGYTDAVAGAAPSEIKIDGQARKLNKQAQRQYDKIRSQVVNGELKEIVTSPFFLEADEKTQTKMLARLYDYAAEKAKKELLRNMRHLIPWQSMPRSPRRAAVLPTASYLRR